MRLNSSNWLISILIVFLIIAFIYINHTEYENHKNEILDYYNNTIVKSIKSHLEHAFKFNEITIENHQIILDSVAKSILKETLDHYTNLEEVAFIALQSSDEIIYLNSDNKSILEHLPKITNEEIITLQNKNSPNVLKYQISNQQIYEIRSALDINLQTPLILRLGLDYQKINQSNNDNILNLVLMTIFLLIVLVLFLNFQDIIVNRPEPLHHNHMVINIFKKIADNHSNGIIFVNPNNKIVIFNSAAESITGLTSKAVIMNDYFEVFPNDYFCLEEVLTNNKSKELTHTHLITESGKTLDVLYSTSILNINNEYNGALISILDYSKFLKSEKQKASLRNIESLAKLAQGIIRSYLNKINQIYLAFQSLPTSNVEQNETLTKFGDIVLSNILDLEALSKEFQEFARFPKLTYTLVVINDVIEQILQSCKQICRNKQINFRKNYQPYISFYTDYKIFYEILSILVENSVESIDTEGEIIFSADFSIDTITLTITDNGCGIPQDVQNNLYNPFNTTKKGHLGFGLAKVNKYIILLEGQISYQTNENKGTTFKIILPNKKEFKISEK